MSSKAGNTLNWRSPWGGLFLTAFSVAGIYAALSLLTSEMAILEDPLTHLGCDLNPLIGCSESILSPQAHLLGVSNSAVGLAAFSALFALGATLMFGGALPRTVWVGLTAGAFVGIAFVAYFLFQSVTAFHSLCPYCLVTWAAALGVAPIMVGGAAASGSLGSAARPFGKSLLKYAWAVVLIGYMLVVLVVIFTMPDQVRAAFA